ncbi:acetyltransferase [Gordonia sp. DT101]|uniref:acetyltransferase n=1 Tax=Gordonia sp. DT101 TaxID=3416545 RepID=UPI003CFB32D7
MTAGLLLLGAGGLTREVLASGIDGVVGILDDDFSLQGAVVGGVPVLGVIASAVDRDESLLVCVGPGTGRRDIVGRLRSLGIEERRFATYVAPSARIGTTSTVGVGSVVLDNVVVTADAGIGRHVVLMPNCTITHDDLIADFATLAAGVTLGGRVRVGEASYLGMNASVRQGLTIGGDVTVGMGAVVLCDVPDEQTWVGMPARPTGVTV